MPDKESKNNLNKADLKAKIMSEVHLTTFTPDLFNDEGFKNQKNINPELRIDNNLLDDPKGPSKFKKLAKKLWAAQLKVTVHGPFMDLSPGGFDPLIRKASLKRIKQALKVAALFNPKHVVFHPCYIAQHFNHNHEQWLETSFLTWKEAAELANDLGLTMVLENTYETGPEELFPLIKELAAHKVGFLFDVAHAHTLGNRGTSANWLGAMGPYLKAVHLHDNYGIIDDHLALGLGKVDFKPILASLTQLKLKPTIILETRKPGHFNISLDYLAENWADYFAEKI